MKPSPATIADQDATPPQPAPPVPAQPPAREQSPGGTAVAPAPTRTKPLPPHRPLDQYKVLLHNDDVSDPIVVVRSIVEIVAMATQQAFKVMLEAEQTGVSLVVVTHLERAELIQDQLQSRGLTITLEKA